MDNIPQEPEGRPDAQPADGSTGQPSDAPSVKRRYGAARIRPRGQSQPPAPSPESPASAPLTPDVIGPESEDDYSNQPGGMPFGGGSGGGLFAPRSFGGGRIQVFGCSPGCLIISLIASVILTLLLNAIL
jgi:hypothetical protein